MLDLYLLLTPIILGACIAHAAYPFFGDEDVRWNP